MPALLPNLWLLDVQREPFRLRYRLAGTTITRCVGREITGQWMDEAQPRSASTAGFFDRYRNVVDTKLASWRKGAPKLDADVFFRRLENILLPLARDGNEVDMLLAMTIYYRSDGAEF